MGGGLDYETPKLGDLEANKTGAPPVARYGDQRRSSDQDLELQKGASASEGATIFVSSSLDRASGTGGERF